MYEIDVSSTHAFKADLGAQKWYYGCQTPLCLLLTTLSAEVIGTISGVVGIIDATFKVIQKIREARDKVRGTSKALDDAFQQLAELEGSLKLVKEEEALRTAVIWQQLDAIAAVTEELRSFLDTLANEQQQKSRITQFAHALKNGDKEDRELQGILSRLDRARAGLVERILVAQVGLVGNLREGFRIAFGVLMETNENVRQVLGTNLALVDRLGSNAAQRAGIHQPGGSSYEGMLTEPIVDGMIPLDASDEQHLGPRAQATTQNTAAGVDETLICDNVTLGQARIMAGNVGEENWRRTVARKTTIKGTRFEKDVIMMGDLTGQAAASFNENFWN